MAGILSLPVAQLPEHQWVPAPPVAVGGEDHAGPAADLLAADLMLWELERIRGKMRGYPPDATEEYND